MSSQRFGKGRRVRRSAEYQQAFKAGIRVHGRFFTLVIAPTGRSPVRLGIVHHLLPGTVPHDPAPRTEGEVPEVRHRGYLVADLQRLHRRAA